MSVSLRTLLLLAPLLIDGWACNMVPHVPSIVRQAETAATSVTDDRPSAAATEPSPPRPMSNGCVFNLDKQSPKYPSHLIDSTKMEIIEPVLVGKDRIIKLADGQTVTVACQGDRNVLLETNESINSATCSLSSLRVGQKNLTYESLGCKVQTKESIVESGACSGVGTRIDIGWKVNSVFIRLLSVCHDLTTASTLYVTNTMRGVSILADDESNKRPSFRKSGYFAGIDVDKAYNQNGQNKTLMRILGNSTSLINRYFNVRNNYFFARGHLAPDGDFLDAASQDATYSYLNCAPQWQSFNGGNWRMLEDAVRNMAARRAANYTIHTGTYGILTLADAGGHQKPIYLGTDVNNNNAIPVPKYYWKIVHNVSSGRATAVVGINNPHLDYVSGADIFCPDVCSQVPWVTFNRTKISMGYTFCCTVDDLRKTVTHAPDLGNLPLLV